MEFELTQEFPVGIDRLWTVLGRADYLERKYKSLGSTSLRVQTFVTDSKSIEVELERKAPVALEQLPLWARLVSGATQAMRQYTRWERVSRDRIDAVLEIRALGRGLVAKGTGSVHESRPGHSRMRLHFAAVTTSPAVPPALAEVFARQVTRALEADHSFTVAYLQGEAPP